MLSDEELLGLAGKAAFSRGSKYHAEGRVQLTRYDAEQVEGTASGSENYSLWLRRTKGRWRWQCSCPAADDGDLCKHLVAAVLTARAALAEDAQDGISPKRARGDDLLAYLRAQPADRLADWLKEFADQDAGIAARLGLFRAADDPSVLKEALSKMLRPGGFLDYRGALQYARRLETVVDPLRALLATDAANCRVLCEFVLGRLAKVLVGSDDSEGAIGDRMAEIAQLHADACAAAPPGKALAKPLLALQQQDGGDLFALEDYWQALGAEGQHAYAKLIADGLARLPAKPREEDRYGESLGIRQCAEKYARHAGDIDLLVRVLRWDLSQDYNYRRLAEALREFGREREASAVLEEGLRRFPRSRMLHSMLAEALDGAGLVEEALEQRWKAFLLEPHQGSWDELKRSAGKSWPAWRARALQHIDLPGTRYGTSSKIALLLHDGDVAAAAGLAQAHPVPHDLLVELARKLTRSSPQMAGEFYLRAAEGQLGQFSLNAKDYPGIAATLQHGARLLPADVWRPRIAAVRAQHARKPKLMEALLQAGL